MRKKKHVFKQHPTKKSNGVNEEIKKEGNQKIP